MKKILLTFSLFYFSNIFCFQPKTDEFTVIDEREFFSNNSVRPNRNDLIIKDEKAKKLLDLICKSQFDEAIKLINDNCSIDFSVEINQPVKNRFDILSFLITNFEFANQNKSKKFDYDKEIELFKLLIDRNDFAGNLKCYQMLKNLLPDFIKHCFNKSYAHVKFYVDIFKLLKQKLADDFFTSKNGEILKVNNLELNCLPLELKTIIADYLVVKDIPPYLINDLFPDENNVLAKYNANVVDLYFNSVECGPDGMANPDKLWHEHPDFCGKKSKGCCTIL